MYESRSRLDLPADRAPELVTAFRGRAHLADQADASIDQSGISLRRLEQLHTYEVVAE